MLEPSPIAGGEPDKSKPALLEKLYDWDRDPDSNALEVFVHHLRRKIDPSIVRTVRGVGYALGAPDERLDDEERG